jgi:5-methylcytosine-specific restriction enzyme subunit McrC
MYPDLVWYPEPGRPGLVVDAKYKADKVPNADVYQLLAYCTALGLSEGHLVYARGVEVPRRYEVVGAGVTVWAHALDLALGPTSLIEQLGGLAGSVKETHTRDE